MADARKHARVSAPAVASEFSALESGGDATVGFPDTRSPAREGKVPRAPPVTVRRDVWNKRVTDEEVVVAYKETGSIWKAAKRLGLVGQSVHERLRRLGYPMAHQEWTEEETREARSLAEQGEPIGHIAARLGRTYWAVALKLSGLGVRSQRTDWRRKPKRGAGLTKERVAAFAKKLAQGKTSVRRLARMEGVAITPLVDALQYYEPERWQRYVTDHSELGLEKCPGCGRDFVPLTRRQEFCTVRCRETHRRNVAYFGGRRSEAIGLREGVCQLCRKRVEKWLSAHHVLGKEKDPENEALIALCRGCHDVVTRLASRPWIEDREVVADLIALALARRGRVNAFVSVDLEDWTAEEVQDYVESLNGTTEEAVDSPVENP